MNKSLGSFNLKDDWSFFVAGVGAEEKWLGYTWVLK